MYEKSRVGIPSVVFFYVHSVVRSVRERKAKKNKTIREKRQRLECVSFVRHDVFAVCTSRVLLEIIIFTRFVYHRVLNTILICFVLFSRAAR